MREPVQVTAALAIAGVVRAALADALERHRETGWDDAVVYVELGRVAGALLRLSDAPPSAVELLVDTLRRAYAALISAESPCVEDLLRELCPATVVDTAGVDVAGDAPVQ